MSTNQNDAFAQLKAELAAAKAENEALKQTREYLKVSAKGAVSLYGIRRFPITFYRDEWQVIFGNQPNVQAFIEEHDAELKSKGDAKDK